MSKTVFTGKVVHEFDSLVSTNEYAQHLLTNEKVIEGTLIRAAHQTGGKGYAGSTWDSEHGQNLLVSIILKPVFLLPKRQFFLNQAIALAVAETVSELTYSEDVRIKWPNDIFHNNKKIAGILIENAVKGNQLLHSVAGIGLNVNQQQFPSHLSHATSMRIMAGKELDMKKVQDVLCEKTEYRYLQLKSDRIEELQKDYMKLLYRVLEECVYRANGVRFNAKIVGLTAEGKLILETGGEQEVYGFKEVEMVL